MLIVGHSRYILAYSLGKLFDNRIAVEIDQLSPALDGRGERTESRVIGLRRGMVSRGSPHQIGQNSNMRTIEFKLEPFLQSGRDMLVTLDNRDPGFVAQMYTIGQQGNFAGQRIVERKFLPPQGTNNHRDDRLLSPAAGNNNPRLLFRPLKYEFRYRKH